MFTKDFDNDNINYKKHILLRLNISNRRMLKSKIFRERVYYSCTSILRLKISRRRYTITLVSVKFTRLKIFMGREYYSCTPVLLRFKISRRSFLMFLEVVLFY